MGAMGTQMNVKNSYAMTLIIGLCLKSIDLITTFFALNIEGFSEGNVIASWFLSQSPLVFVIFSITMFLIPMSLLKWGMRKFEPLSSHTKTVYGIMLLLLLIPVTNNLINLIQWSLSL
ncbi:MAG: hypothetical protein QG670_1774 [Thermoproteota archaeon]|nr:hypothetical protein [Thermoproteota archaeon]